MTAKTTPAYFIRRVLYQCYKVIIDPIMLMWVANVTHPCPKATMASIFKQTSMPIHTIFYYTTEFRVMTVIIKNLSLINSLSLHNIKTNNALIPKANWLQDSVNGEYCRNGRGWHTYGLHLRKFVHTQLPQVGFELGSLVTQASVQPIGPPLLVVEVVLYIFCVLSSLYMFPWRT